MLGASRKRLLSQKAGATFGRGSQLGKFEAEQFSGISQQVLAVSRVLEKLYDRLRTSQQPGLQQGTQFSNAASDSATSS